MVHMKALVGFSLADGAAAGGATFNAKAAKAADRLEASGVAERVKGSEKMKARSSSLPDPHS